MKKAPFKDTPRIEWKNGAWRYRPKKHELPFYDNKSWVRIGLFENEVYEFLANKARLFRSPPVSTISSALTRYTNEVLPLKSYKTQETNRTSIKRLERTFGKAEPSDLTYPDIIEYRDLCAQKHGRGAANADLEVLSHLYTKLIEWGVIGNRDHPLRGMKYKFPKIPRDKYVDHEEIIEAHQIASPFFKIWIPFKLKTALDQITIVSIRMDDVTEEGIYYRRRKLNRYDSERKPRLKVILWDEELIKLVGQIEALRSQHPAREYLFSNANGKQYVDSHGTANPVRRAWGRLKKHAKNKNISMDYTEHDLRAKSLSDEEELAVAIQRGDHSSGGNTTSRVYRRKAEPVMPLNLAGIGLSELMGKDHDAHVCLYYWRNVIQTPKS